MARMEPLGINEVDDEIRAAMALAVIGILYGAVADFFHFLLRQKIAARFIDAQFATDSFCRIGAVTGQQDHPITLRF